MENIVKIIDLLLAKNQLKTDILMPTSIYPTDLIITGISVSETIEILKKLEISNYIKINSRATGEWPVCIINHNTNQELLFTINEEELIHFRNALLDKYINNTTNKSDDRVKITISRDFGIYRDDDKTFNYPIRGQQRIRLIRCLWNEGQQSIKLSIIAKQLAMNEPLVKKEINLINKLFGNKLDLDKDLIVHIPTGGYKLNNEKYNIIFEKP